MQQAAVIRSAGGDAPIDMVHLARHTLGNRDLEREVLMLFARQTTMVFARLDGDLAANARADQIHTIVGSAKGIGAWKVAEVAKNAETALRVGESVDLGDLRAAVDEATFFIDGVLEA